MGFVRVSRKVPSPLGVAVLDLAGSGRYSHK